ncbi:MAG: glycosyltransferase family 9 protein, partial [Bacteroidota bacterium]
MQNEITVLLLGTSEQRNTIDSIVKNNNLLINCAGKLSILESAALVKKSRLFIGNDSGFTHIAKALGIPYIGIIG